MKGEGVEPHSEPVPEGATPEQPEQPRPELAGVQLERLSGEDAARQLPEHTRG